MTFVLPLPGTPQSRPRLGDIGILGNGNSAHALAFYLGHKGHAVHLLARRPGSSRHIQAVGALSGHIDLARISTRPEEILADCGTLFIATDTRGYEEIATGLAPYLTPDHRVILFSSKLAGSVLFERVLADHGVRGVSILETDALFACRLQPDGAVWVRGIKGWTYYSGPRASVTSQQGACMREFFPQLEPAQNVLQRGLTDFGALCHPIVMLANMTAVDRQQPFLFYREGLSERTVVLLERMESEFRMLAAAYGTSLIPMPELLNRYYGCDTTDLLTAMRTVPNYRHSLSPDGLDHRFLLEDVACTLVPLYGLARKAGIDTPIMDSVIHLATALCGVDFLQSGRNLRRLGWADWSASDIQAWLNS